MQQPQRSILMVAGEASADLHGAKVVRALRQQQPGLSVFGVGGAAMRAEGFDAFIPAEKIAVAGLTEVLLVLPRLWLYMRRLRRLAAERQPCAAVLIDMPDFNLRLARHLKKLGVPVVYYISPQLWAWRQGRVRQIRELVDRMLVILPFEKDFYDRHGVPVTFVGHPLVEELLHSPDRAAARHELGLPEGEEGPIVALLPGSRRKEITRHLPTMLAGIRELLATVPHVHPVIPVASTIPRALIDRLVARTGIRATVVDGRSTEVLSAADAAVVCSGTATLQTALLARPMVVVYRASWLTFHILKRLVTVAHIALVNLIAGRTLVPELIQADFTPRNIATELRRLLGDAAVRARLETELRALRDQLGSGNTAAQVADVVAGYLPAAASPVADARAEAAAHHVATGAEAQGASGL